MKSKFLKTWMVAGVLGLMSASPSLACSIFSFLPPPPKADPIFTPPSFDKGGLESFFKPFTPPKVTETDLEEIFNHFLPPTQGPNFFKIGHEPAPAAVPEPGTLALMGFGVLGVAAASRRRRKNQLS